MTAPAPALHVGKLDKRVETSLPEPMDIWIAAQAHAMGIREADFIRELIFKAATGQIYSVHVANDKAAAFERQHATLQGLCGSRAGVSE